MMRTFLSIALVSIAGVSIAAAQATPLQPGAAANAPKPPAAIAAAKAAAAQVDQAHEKNAEALDKQAPAKPSAPPPPAAAGQPAATPPPQGAQTPATSADKPAAAAYSYDPNGRRDPFVNLLSRGSDMRQSGATRPPGLPGQMVGELTLKGVIKGKSGFVAILQASDNKTYIGRPGDRVLDGSIKSIAQDAVVFSQDVNDPLSLVKEREVRKAIRSETK
jgi:Tfp pilus assembly protein PilP